MKTGNKALRFEVRGNQNNDCALPESEDEHSDSGSARAEVYRGGCWHGKCDANSGPATSKWYSWNILIPKGIKPTDKRGPVVGQWKHQHCGPTVQLKWNSPDRKYKGNYIQLENNGVIPDMAKDNDAWTPKVQYGGTYISSGIWNNIRLHIVWSDQNDGRVEWWVNDKRIVSRKGPTLFPDDLDCGGVYSKFGLYRGRGGGYKSGNSILYWDNHREGKSLKAILQSKDVFSGLTGEKKSKKKKKKK